MEMASKRRFFRANEFCNCLVARVLRSKGSCKTPFNEDFIGYKAEKVGLYKIIKDTFAGRRRIAYAKKLGIEQLADKLKIMPNKQRLMVGMNTIGRA